MCVCLHKIRLVEKRSLKTLGAKINASIQLTAQNTFIRKSTLLADPEQTIQSIQHQY